MTDENEFPLNEDGRRVAEQLIAWHAHEGGGNCFSALFMDPGKEMGLFPTFASQIADLVAMETGSQVLYVDCPRSMEDAQRFVEELGPMYDSGGVVHLDFGDLEDGREDFAARLIRGIQAKISTNPGPLIVIAETSRGQVPSNSLHGRFDFVQRLETVRPEPEPAPFSY